MLEGSAPGKPLMLLALAHSALMLSLPSQAATRIETDALAISWEPAFCITQPSKAECQTQTASRWDASHFSLHGLWPQNGSYCGVDQTQKSEDENGQWNLLPQVVLNQGTETELRTEMPGTMSYLDRHEWIEHGTCSGDSQQDFFAPTLAMLDSVNAGRMTALVVSHIGGTVTLSQLQGAVVADYGTRASKDIEFLCISSSGKPYLEEVRIHMRLPNPLPDSVRGSYLAKPLRPAFPSQLCPASGSIYVKAVTN